MQWPILKGCFYINLNHKSHSPYVIRNNFFLGVPWVHNKRIYLNGPLTCLFIRLTFLHSSAMWTHIWNERNKITLIHIYQPLLSNNWTKPRLTIRPEGWWKDRGIKRLNKNNILHKQIQLVKYFSNFLQNHC